MISESNMKVIKESVRSINEKLSEEDRKYSFWTPKDFWSKGKKREGYALYAYGGTVTILYETYNRVSCAFLDDKEYAKYFGSNWESVKVVRRRIKDAPYSSKTKETKIDRLKEISADEWRLIFQGYKQRAERTEEMEETPEKLYLERERETAISHNHRDINTMFMITMEKYFDLSEDHTPRVDMIGIRKSEDEYVLSFIEYKCTDVGMKGVTLAKHYDDMKKYYNDDNVKETLVEYLGRKIQADSLDFPELPDISKETLKTEIVFLFSHVNVPGKGGIPEKIIKNEIDLLKSKVSEGEFNAIRIIYIQDEDEIMEFAD